MDHVYILHKQLYVKHRRLWNYYIIISLYGRMCVIEQRAILRLLLHEHMHDLAN